ncbi:MAG: linalool dehydratase/isomerase domain-containing protein [Phycisphaerae bacterium]
MSVANSSFRLRFLLSLVSIAVGTTIWLPLLHFAFRPGCDQFRDPTGISPIARQLARRQMDLWVLPSSGKDDIEKMRINNPEWDFMGRTFLVLSLANMCLRQPQQQDEYLKVMDEIIQDTDRLAQNKGVGYFLLDYANQSQFVQQPVRSIFVDGELAMMMGARRLVAEHEGLRERMRELVHITADRMIVGPVLSCESYPNECWTFCNTVALAATRMHEVLDGEDYGQLRRDWIAKAKEKLVHQQTGLLCSSYTYEGQAVDGPEGSTIWMAAHWLQIVDEDFAEDQYRRAKHEIAHQCLGFGWAGEWPKSWAGPMDIDSGPVIPFVDVSAGSSGQAFVAAASFDDVEYYRSLTTTLMFAGYPLSRDGRMQFCASNQVGDAVLLYSGVAGPLWREIRERGRGVTTR